MTQRSLGWQGADIIGGVIQAPMGAEADTPGVTSGVLTEGAWSLPLAASPAPPSLK